MVSANSFDKSVKGATKIKAAPPKTKYLEHILTATQSGDHAIAEVFRALVPRLRETTWTVVLKGLYTVHFMIRDGVENETLKYLAKHPNVLAVNAFSDVQSQGRNIRNYATYLGTRGRAYAETKTDWVRDRTHRLEKLTVDKGLLREMECVQRQLAAALLCNVMEQDPDNDIIICIFRLLVGDVLKLFQAANLGMINVLGTFFEMAKTDADRAMDIYRQFAKQTDAVMQYLNVARRYDYLTRITVGHIKHAPITLGRQLDEYLKDPDFEANRRQFLLERENKKKGGKLLQSGSSVNATAKFGASISGSQSNASANSGPSTSNTTAPENRSAAPAKTGDVDLIDLFDSIENHQTTMVIQDDPMQQWVAPPDMSMTQFQQVQPTGFYGQPAQIMPQGTGMNPFGQPTFQMQPTGPFGGGLQQPGFAPGALGTIPQYSAVSFFPGNLETMATVMGAGTAAQQPMATGTNPFRQSTIALQTTSGNLNRQPTNPFSKDKTGMQGQQQQQQQQQQQPGFLPPQPTGTNPFSKKFASSNTGPVGGIMPQPTGTTNPFRNSSFTDHQTGLGWQHAQQPLGGGLDSIETVPVFPRPAPQSPWQG